MHLVATALLGGVFGLIFICAWCAVIDGATMMSGWQESTLLAVAFLGALIATGCAVFWLFNLAYHTIAYHGLVR